MSDSHSEVVFSQLAVDVPYGRTSCSVLIGEPRPTVIPFAVPYRLGIIKGIFSLGFKDETKED